MSRDGNSDTNPESDQFSMPRRSALVGAGVGLGALSSRRLWSARESEEPPGEGRADDVAETARGREDFSATVDEGLPGDKFGKARVGPYSHALQVSGTRRPAWMVQPFSADYRTTSTSYERAGSDIGYGVIPFPPGQVPILRAVGHFDNGASSTTSLRISIANIAGNEASGEFVPLDDRPARQTILELNGQGETQIYDEAYLSEFVDVVAGGAGGGSNGTEYPINTFIVEVKTDDPDREAVIRAATTVSLELEAL